MKRIVCFDWREASRSRSRTGVSSARQSALSASMTAVAQYPATPCQARDVRVCTCTGPSKFSARFRLGHPSRLAPPALVSLEWHRQSVLVLSSIFWAETRREYSSAMTLCARTVFSCTSTVLTNVNRTRVTSHRQYHITLASMRLRRPGGLHIKH